MHCQLFLPAEAPYIAAYSMQKAPIFISGFGINMHIIAYNGILYDHHPRYIVQPMPSKNWSGKAPVHPVGST